MALLLLVFHCFRLLTSLALLCVYTIGITGTLCGQPSISLVTASARAALVHPVYSEIPGVVSLWLFSVLFSMLSCLFRRFQMHVVASLRGGSPCFSFEVPSSFGHIDTHP